MNISVFLNFPKPYRKNQKIFIEQLGSYLKELNFEPKTLRVTDYNLNAPLSAIRRLMFESNGIITVAFRRSYIKSGKKKPNNGFGDKQKKLDGKWLTSPFCHMEPAMAYQLGLLVLIFREKDVLDDGILGKGILGNYMPEFDLDKIDETYFTSNEFRKIMGRWEGKVRQVAEEKGYPPNWFIQFR